MKPLSAGPPTQQDLYLHQQIVVRCNDVVEKTRGTPVQAGIRRGILIGGPTGAAGGAAGSEAWNAVGTAGKMAVGPMAALYGSLNAVYGFPTQAINYRDQNGNLVLTCVRDGEGATNGQAIVWYAPSEAGDPRVTAAFQGAATYQAPVYGGAPQQPPQDRQPQGQTNEQQSSQYGQPFWPPAGQ
ncbi:MAG: hypothetical protein ACM3TU_02930 [Bacillota bacterium]